MGRGSNRFAPPIFGDHQVSVSSAGEAEARFFF